LPQKCTKNDFLPGFYLSDMMNLFSRRKKASLFSLIFVDESVAMKNLHFEFRHGEAKKDAFQKFNHSSDLKVHYNV